MMKHVTILTASEMNDIWTDLNTLQKEVVERLIVADAEERDIKLRFEKLKEIFE